MYGSVSGEMGLEGGDGVGRTSELGGSTKTPK